MNDAIVEGIKDFRKSQLKARLSAITIPPAVPVNFWAGVGSAAIIGGITATVIYNMAIDDPEVIEKEIVPQTEENQALNSVESNAYDISEELNQNKAEEETKTQPANTQQVNIIQSPSSTDNENNIVEEYLEEETNTESTTDPQTQVVLPPVPDDNAGFEPNSSEIDEIENSRESRMEKMDVEIRQHPEYNFHYKYSNHKLFLYGSLEKEPYRLLELEQNGGRNLYLAYDHKYYYLKDQTITPEPLKPIKDKNLPQEP